MIVLKLLAVLGLASLELWAAFPLGIAFRLQLGAVGVAAGVGGILGVLVVVFAGGKLRGMLLRNRGHRPAKDRKHERAARLWQRYGVWGVGLLAPFIVGIPLAAAFGVSLGAPPLKLALLLSLVVVFWCVLLTVGGHFAWQLVRGLKIL